MDLVGENNMRSNMNVESYEEAVVITLGRESIRVQEKLMMEEQCGFRRGRGGVDQISVLK